MQGRAILLLVAACLSQSLSPVLGQSCSTTNPQLAAWVQSRQDSVSIVRLLPAGSAKEPSPELILPCAGTPATELQHLLGLHCR